MEDDPKYCGPYHPFEIAQSHVQYFNRNGIAERLQFFIQLGVLLIVLVLDVLVDEVDWREGQKGIKMVDKVLIVAWVFTSSLEILDNQITGVLALTDTLCCALGHLGARHFEVDSGLFNKINGTMR